MKVSTVLASAAILPIMIGMAQLAPAAAAAPAPTQLKFLFGNQNANVQTVHCRRFVHVHRRCTLWRGGVCRRWIKYTHRCG
ncbi:MAG: hypothetical protein RLZ98_767 [Pseudomonadota bacterium]|jgi:hypothetical protein